jgi:Zn-dependent alcohol dehydrogenase
MNKLFRTIFKFGPALLLLIAGAAAAMGQSAKLQLDQLDVLANRASDTVDVKLDEHLMQMTAKFFNPKDSDEAEIRDLIKNVKGVYVKSFSFEKENEYSSAEIESVMSQLRGGGWSKIIGVTSKKDGDNVEVYLLTIGDQISGLAVVSAEPKEFTIVNVVGPIDLEKLSKLEGSFGVPYLNLPPAKPKTDKEVK